MRPSTAAWPVALVVVLGGCGSGGPAPEPPPTASADPTPLDMSDDDLVRLVRDGPDRDWVCTNLPPELAEPVLSGTGEVTDQPDFAGGCLVQTPDRATVLRVRSGGRTESVPDEVEGVIADRRPVDLPGGVDAWVVEVPPFASAAGVYARAVGRTSEGEPRAVDVHLAPGTQGRDLVGDAEVLLRYYVLLNDVTGPLVGEPSS